MDELKQYKVKTSKEALEMLGLERCKVLFSAGCALPKECYCYFKSIGLTITEAYGMSENTGGITINPLSQTKIGSVGYPFPGTSIRINNPDESGSGEVYYIHLKLMTVHAQRVCQ